MSKHVFTYGSLMFPQVWQRVVSGHYCASAATLSGYARFALKDDTYPGMIPVDNETVSGVVYHDVDALDLLALDAFEGSEYRRCSVQVDAGTAGAIWAETYIFLPHHRLTRQMWDPAAFAIERFIGSYCPKGDV